jgi:superfamily II DNA/RNA helicase
MLFSATLDGGVDVIVKRFLSNPITHSVDSAQSPVAKMSHHVLHVQHDDRLPVLVDLTAAPGRTLVFTRTKHGAKKLTRQLIASGVPAVELHGNLAQNARTRNLTAFADGTADTLVATDIAARGIHVDDVSLVVHADPPVEHKAYLHRSGRTARAGAGGTVVTLMTDDQVSDVRDLTRKAAIKPTTTRLRPGHPLLAELAPGERIFVSPPVNAISPDTPRGSGSGRGSRSGTSTPRSGSSQRGTSGGSGQRGGSSSRGAGSSSRGAGSSSRGAGSSSRGASSSSRASGSSGGAHGGSASAARPARTYTTSSSPAAPRATGAAAFSAGARPRGRRSGG